MRQGEQFGLGKQTNLRGDTLSPKAIIQGEYHRSERDKERLLSRRTEDSEAFFIEGRSDMIHLVEYSKRYYLFLVGILLILALNTGRNFNGVKGLETHSDIDAEYHEIWEKAGEIKERDIRNILYWILVLIPTFFIIASFIISAVIFISGTPSGSLSVILIVIIIPISVIGTPIIFSGFIAVSLEGEERDEIMAQNIVSESQENNYSEVLVLCGDSHVQGITEYLEEQGWTVCMERSKHPLSQVNSRLFG